MTIALGHRIGQSFFHRDTRLPEGHPTIMHSVDVSSDFSTPKRRREVRLEYGRDGRGQLVVEVALAQPDPFVFWTHAWFPVQWLWRTENLRHESLLDLARKLGRAPREVAQILMAHAPRPGRKRQRPKGPPALALVN